MSPITGDENVSALYGFLYGTELPDNPEGYGDTTKHHVYYYENEDLQDNASAVRAEEEYRIALEYLKDKNYISAAKYAGIMTHYIADLAVFGHVMGKDTDWGAETHHSDYEKYVNDRTSSYDSTGFGNYILFDGRLKNISAYKAQRIFK